MEQEHIITRIESGAPILREEERDTMWRVVSSRLPVPSPLTVTPSPFLFTLTRYKPMTALILTLLLIIGGGGTAMASDAARPGDFLYPLERVIEDTRLTLTVSPEGRAALTRTLTEERLSELREIIDEETIVTPSNVTSDTLPLIDTVSGSTTVVLAIEVGVFTDTTIVKVELNDRIFYFETIADTREEVLGVLKEKFPTLTSLALESALSFEYEDRASRPKDRGIVSLREHGESRINTAMNAILTFLETTTEPGDTHRNEALSAVMDEIDTQVRVTHEGEETRLDSRNNRYEIRLRDDGESRIEVRNGDTRVRIEKKDGEVRIRTKSGEDGHSDGTSLDTTPGSTTQRASLEVEADVFTDTTLVVLEWQNEKVVFETRARTRDEVITAVLQKFPALTRGAVDAALVLEVENRASRPADVSSEAVDDSRDGGDNHSEDVRGQEDDEDEGGGGKERRGGGEGEGEDGEEEYEDV